jgi:hypothetical protein
MKNIKNNLIIILFYTVISTGVFYSSAKFHVPWYGANDFAVYHDMIKKPFSNNANSPYGYRILTPIIAHYVEKSGIYYKTSNSPFKDNLFEYENKQYDSEILDALIFTNFILIIFSMFILYKTYEKYYNWGKNKEINLLFLLMPLGLMLSTSTIVHGLNGLTEGGSIFFISLCCFLIARGNIFIFTIAVFLGMFQRELVPLVVFIYCIFINKYRFALISLLAFMAYFILRNLHPLTGFEEQLNLIAFFQNIKNFNLTKEFFLQVILSNNIVLSLIIVYFIEDMEYRKFKYLLPFAMVFGMLLLISLGTGIGNNAGRILNMATPILMLAVPKLLNIKFDSPHKLLNI